jgi:formylglycine-generating enzyme required for sulfatase activity
MKIAAFSLAGLILSTSACASLIGLEEGVLDEGSGGTIASSSSASTTGSGGSGGGGGTGGAGGSGGAGGAPLACPVTGRGPVMTIVPGPGGSNYCIDSTEVTVSQYIAFLSDAPDPSTQTALCSFNADFVPTKVGNSCNYYDFANAMMKEPNEPLRCADWCDAAMFCQWAGKRLCGKIGGGPNDPAAFADPTASQWFRACSKDGSVAFPYGDVYDGTACVGADYNGMAGYQPATDYPHDVTVAKGCVGGYPDIFDMSGNLQEWEDSCGGASGMDDNCYARGGSYADSVMNLTCSSTLTYKRSAGAIAVGFRCCADLN